MQMKYFILIILGSFSEMNKQFKNVKMVVNVDDEIAQKFINSKLEV